ncbi:hypothetical protein Tco_0421258 [Tanacetum coccineum]
MATEVPQTLEYRGGQLNVARRLESRGGKFHQLKEESVENMVENESHFSLKIVDQDLSSLTMFTKHLMVESMGGIGGGSFSKHSMVAKDGLGGDGFVVDGGRSPSKSRKDREDVVEWLLEELVELPMCSPMVERMVDREEKKFLD